MRTPTIHLKRIPVKGWALLLAAALWLQVCPAYGQEQPKISVEVKVVNVLATVHDKHGQIVSNLGKDDFALEEDGRPQTIAYFSKDTNIPLTLGLLVDTSQSQRRVLDQERTASQSFLDDLLRVDKDKAFVIHFDREVELLQDLTSSRPKLQAALQMLDTSQADQQGSSGGGGSRSRSGGGTLLYDAVYLASDDVIKKQQGRKALIVLSDGVDHGSKESLVTAIATAQRADTVVYSILFKDEEQSQDRRPFGGFGGPGMGRHGGGGGRSRYPQEERPEGKKILERISKETGGRLFEVTKKEPIEQIYKTIEEELRNQYSIGYTPAADVGAGYHRIVLTVKQKDMSVQARDGYYTDR
jgi:VWFA-related protein